MYLSLYFQFTYMCMYLYFYVFILIFTYYIYIYYSEMLHVKHMLFLSNRFGPKENGIQALISATDLELYHMLSEMGFWVQEKTW